MLGGFVAAPNTVRKGTISFLNYLFRSHQPNRLGVFSNLTSNVTNPTFGDSHFCVLHLRLPASRVTALAALAGPPWARSVGKRGQLSHRHIERPLARSTWPWARRLLMRSRTIPASARPLRYSSTYFRSRSILPAWR